MPAPAVRRPGFWSNWKARSLPSVDTLPLMLDAAEIGRLTVIR
jgi:hypothetical protein